MEFKTKGIMRYFLIIILGLFLWTGCNDDDEKLTPSTEPEFRYVLPQGDHDYDTKIVSWYEDCGIYFLYKFENKDVYYNEVIALLDMLKVNGAKYISVATDRK